VRRALVTGACGFIGRHAVAALRERDFEVHTVSRRAGAADHVDDLSDPRALLARVRPTHLLHLAWYVEHGAFWSARENLDWVARSALLLRAFEGERFVGAGTCAEYDWTAAAGVLAEGVSPLGPATLYGVCKDAVRRVGEASRDGFAWGRVFFPYGAGEAPGRLVASVARSVLAGEPALCSSGDAVRDFIHVSDVGAAFAALLDSDVRGAVNIGSGEGVRIAEVARRTAALAGDAGLLRLGAIPDRADDPPQLVAAVRRLRDEVGFAARTSLDEGLAEAVAGWRTP
jgi:nucleoside-diphosphate-sugar epimerase